MSTTTRQVVVSVRSRGSVLQLYSWGDGNSSRNCRLFEVRKSGFQARRAKGLKALKSNLLADFTSDFTSKVCTALPMALPYDKLLHLLVLRRNRLAVLASSLGCR